MQVVAQQSPVCIVFIKKTLGVDPERIQQMIDKVSSETGRIVLTIEKNDGQKE